MRLIVRLAVLVALLGVPLGATHAMGQLFFMENSNLGKAAPDFTLDTLKSRNVNMTRYRDGKSAIVFFWATWCPHCREALQGLNNNATRLAEKGIKVILVDIGESSVEVKEHVEKNRVNFDVFLDKDTSLGEPYGIIGVPTFFFLDDKGIVKAVEHSLPDNYEETLLKKEVSKEIVK